MFSRAPPFLHLTCSLNGPPPFLTKYLLETKQVSRQHLPLPHHLNSKEPAVSRVAIYESSRPLLAQTARVQTLSRVPKGDPGGIRLRWHLRHQLASRVRDQGGVEIS
jgi:hypothetical protein